MKSIITLTALMIVPLVASAALPPQFQRQKELTSIIESADVAEALQGQSIDSIETEGDDVYTVTAGDCRVDVTIVSQPRIMPSGWAGPRQYRLSVGEAECGSSKSGR
jgi:hypothetical protein